MILTLDNLASRYHCLPSEVLCRATTFDLYVLDVSAKWALYQQQYAGTDMPERIPTQEEMLEMIRQVRGE